MGKLSFVTALNLYIQNTSRFINGFDIKDGLFLIENLSQVDGVFNSQGFYGSNSLILQHSVDKVYVLPRLQRSLADITG